MRFSWKNLAYKKCHILCNLRRASIVKTKVMPIQTALFSWSKGTMVNLRKHKNLDPVYGIKSKFVLPQVVTHQSGAKATLSFMQL